MQEKSEKLIYDFLAQSGSISDDIMKDTEKMLGTMPYIFPVMRERPENFVLSALGDYRTCRPEHLSPKVSELIAIAAAAGSGADNCLKVHIHAAHKEGATRDEIFDTIMIAAMMGRTKILSTALRQMVDAYPQKSQQ